MKKTILIVLLASTVLVGCTNVGESRFPNLPSEERDGMTLSIVDIDCSEQRTAIKVQFSYQPTWELDKNILPSVSFLQALLFNQDGFIYQPQEASSSNPVYDASTNRLVVDLEWVVEDDACEADNLTFESALVLMEIPADRPIVINLSNHEIGDEWAVNKVVHFDELIVTVESVKLTARHQLRNDDLYEYPAIEIQTHSVAGENIELRCIYIGFSFNENQPYLRGSRGCLSTEDLITSYTMIGEPVPEGEPVTFSASITEFIVMGDLILIEPWRLSWDTNDEG